jgi:hypothetical protein
MSDARPTIETRILNRLQERKRGQTLEQLAEFLPASQALTRATLVQLQKEGDVFFAVSVRRSFQLPINNTDL